MAFAQNVEIRRNTIRFARCAPRCSGHGARRIGVRNATGYGAAAPSVRPAQRRWRRHDSDGARNAKPSLRKSARSGART
jgi:hypothetical protein